MTGWGADLIVIDDPIKGLDAALSAAERRRVAEFYDGSLYTRLNNKAEGAIVIIMQRLHEDDLVGHVLEKESWRVLSIPAHCAGGLRLSDRRRIPIRYIGAARGKYFIRPASRTRSSRLRDAP